MSSSKIELEYCYSCNKTISPTVPGSVKFACPKCGGLIIRCSECRRLSNKYNCPSCDFEGP